MVLNKALAIKSYVRTTTSQTICKHIPNLPVKKNNKKTNARVTTEGWRSNKYSWTPESSLTLRLDDANYALMKLFFPPSLLPPTVKHGRYKH